MPKDRLMLGQGAYYFLTGVWPLLHMPSFLSVTGPKTDLWLVKTAGALIAVIGACLFLSGAQKQAGAPLAVLGAASAFCLAAVDIVYSAKRKISVVYLADAAVETILFCLWILQP